MYSYVKGCQGVNQLLVGSAPPWLWFLAAVILASSGDAMCSSALTLCVRRLLCAVSMRQEYNVPELWCCLSDSGQETQVNVRFCVTRGATGLTFVNCGLYKRSAMSDRVNQVCPSSGIIGCSNLSADLHQQPAADRTAVKRQPLVVARYSRPIKQSKPLKIKMKAWSCQGLALAVVAAALLLHPAMANGANRKMLQTGWPMFANGNMGNGVFPPMQGFGGVTWTFGSGTSFGGNGLAGSGSYNAVQVFSDFKNPLFRAQGTSTFTLYNIALNKSIWNNCYPAVTFTAFKNGVQSGAPVTTASGCSYLLVTFGADFENINEVRMSFAGDRWFIQQIWTSIAPPSPPPPAPPSPPPPPPSPPAPSPPPPVVPVGTAMFANGNTGSGAFPQAQGFGGFTWTFGSGTSFGGNGLAGMGSYNAVQVFSDFKNPLFRGTGGALFNLNNIALNKSIWNNCYPAVTFTAWRGGVQQGAAVTTSSGCAYLLVAFPANFQGIDEVRMSFAGDRWFLQQIWTS